MDPHQNNSPIQSPNQANRQLTNTKKQNHKWQLKKKLFPPAKKRIFMY